MRFRHFSTFALVASALLHPPAHAQDESLPPRSEWRASSSAVENPALASMLAIDGDVKTRWGGAFSAGHWFQLDFGRVASVGGLIIRWDSGFAESYEIQSSIDAQRWRTAYDTADSPGDIEYVFFPTVKARYLRLSSKPRTADWMASMFEFEPLAANAVPRIVGLADSQDSATLWTEAAPRTLSSQELRVQFPKPLEIAGLEVFWAAPRNGARLEANATSSWRPLWDDPGSLGDSSFLTAREPVIASELRLRVTPQPGHTPRIRRLRLLSASRVMTPLKRYEIRASRSHRELHPETLHRQQVYWTATGIPGGVQKTVLDEYGNVEAFKGAPLVQPVWRSDAGVASAASTAIRTHSLREGWMPIPSVSWSTRDGMRLTTEVFTLAHRGAPLTLARYRLHNPTSTSTTGTLSLAVRPLQVNPQWQHGGVSPLRTVAIDGSAAHTSVRVNGRTLVRSLTAVDARGAAEFGAHGESEITSDIAAGTVPPASSAKDDDGLAAALLNYRIELAPGAARDVVVAFPLANEHVDLKAIVWPDAPSIDREQLLGNTSDPASGYERLAKTIEGEWQARVGRIRLSLPDRSLVDMLRAQVAYMLINQTGQAMQPGPRNYNRSFIRDGSATAAALARMGMTQVARDYLRWYADHAVHPNGLVSPILNEDGSVNRGFGSDLEHDSQGQFVWLVAEIARIDGGPNSVREYQPKVELALKYLEELRQRTLAPGYAADRESPGRFRGLIAPSISHEGYSVPTHSYWDDYFALQGWRDGAWLARGWGNARLAEYAQKQYESLRQSVRESIAATIAWKRLDYIPASADLGDWDPTSVSIALDPTGQKDLLPADTLAHTFARYLNEVRSRDAPNALYAYTPYEMRNVLTFVHLNRPQDANELLASLLRHRRPKAWHVLAEVVHSRERHDGYLGDMPHTWIGAEYVRAIFGMLMREEHERLYLLPGAPVSWLRDAGIRTGRLPTAFGPLSMSARQEGASLHIQLEPGLERDTTIQVVWPSRIRPMQVTIDGKPQMQFDEFGIAIAQPFSELIARW